MKTKLTLLAATLLVGFSATSAIANPWKGMPPVFTPKASAPAKPAFQGCCNTSTRYTTNQVKGGVQANKSITCNIGCNMPHAGKACPASALKHCAN
ncbi:MAG: hypothetical protein U1F71_23705 [Verrucomicrobiaceae bacterium]